jgi:hypothetical protein
VSFSAVPLAFPSAFLASLLQTNTLSTLKTLMSDISYGEDKDHVRYVEYNDPRLPPKHDKEDCDRRWAAIGGTNLDPSPSEIAEASNEPNNNDPWVKLGGAFREFIVNVAELENALGAPSVYGSVPPPFSPSSPQPSPSHLHPHTTRTDSGQSGTSGRLVGTGEAPILNPNPPPSPTPSEVRASEQTALDFSAAEATKHPWGYPSWDERPTSLSSIERFRSSIKQTYKDFISNCRPGRSIPPNDPLTLRHELAA